MEATLTALIIKAIASHPNIFWSVVGGFLGATLLNHAIKFTWSYPEMPKWARMVLGFTMPIAFNFYHLSGKVGLKEPDDSEGKK